MLKDPLDKATRTGRNPFVQRSGYGQVREGNLNALNIWRATTLNDNSRQVSVLGRNSTVVPWVRVNQNGGSAKLLGPLDLYTSYKQHVWSNQAQRTFNPRKLPP